MSGARILHFFSVHYIQPVFGLPQFPVHKVGHIRNLMVIFRGKSIFPFLVSGKIRLDLEFVIPFKRHILVIAVRVFLRRFPLQGPFVILITAEAVSALRRSTENIIGAVIQIRRVVHLFFLGYSVFVPEGLVQEII